MWHKSDGDGVLEGAEARLLKTAIAAYVENLREHCAWNDGPDTEWVDQVRENWLGVVQVQRMEHGQRLHVIASVTRALLDPTVLAPELTADTEATVYQIYQFLVSSSMSRSASATARRLFRTTRLAIAACEFGQHRDRDDEVLCGDTEWRGIVETLADRVLWDRDWEMDATLGNADPAVATATKVMVGIEDGYFATPAEEPTPQQVVEAKAYLESIADEIKDGVSRVGIDGEQ